MKDIISSISTVLNFMGNAGRNTYNDYLYSALEDAVEAMKICIPKKCVKESCPDHTHYKCPNCGKIQKTEYKNSVSGCILNNCSNCGQRLEE